MAKSQDPHRRPAIDIAEAQEAIEEGVERAKAAVREVTERLQERAS